jgi:hypothetical protein
MDEQWLGLYERLWTARWAHLATADGVHLYELRTPAGQDIGAELDGLRQAHGIPADWIEHPDRGRPATRHPDGRLIPGHGHGWDVSTSTGAPHPSLLRTARVHLIDDPT